MVVLLLVVLPVSVLAQDSGLIPCGIDKNGDGIVSNFTTNSGGQRVEASEPEECGFNDIVQLGINIVDFLVGFSILLAVIGFIVAGFKIMTAGPDPGQMSDGKKLLRNIAIGFFFVLAAWLIVNTITSVLFQEGFSLIG